MKRDILIEADYPHPPQKVWRALTDPKLMARWLMENDFQPRLGHKFQFRMKPQPGFDGIINCEVIEFDQPHRLTYSWVGGPLRSQVRFSLTPTPTGTRLRLEHTGFEGLKAVLLSFLMGGGWGKMLRRKIPALVGQMDETGNVVEFPRPEQSCESSWGKRVFARVLSLIPGGK
ncbi:MAG: SRPBCC domain-containing protein [Deltaproteobacteria bacterium]|nr:SRPBCC domain-containing protein [Deltaproteobacteria bacterium]